MRTKGASDVTVASEVDKALAVIRAANPEVAINLIDTSVRYTEGDFKSAMHTLFEGAALAVIVVFLFLRDPARDRSSPRSTLPLSIIPRLLGP